MSWFLHHWKLYVVIMLVIFHIGQILITLGDSESAENEKERLFFTGLCLIWPLPIVLALMIGWVAVVCYHLPLYIRNKYKAWKEWGV